MSVKGDPGIIQPQHQKGSVLRLFLIISTCLLVCFSSEHWSSYAPGCSVFYTTVDASGSHCDSFSVLDGPEHLLMTKEGNVITEYHFPPRLIYVFILFTTANDKRYLTLYKLVISITIIISIINKWYATISGMADENIDDAGNLHK